MTHCIFCKIAQAEEKARIIYSDDDIVAFNDINPQAPIHIIVIPRKHIETISECGPEDLTILVRILEVCGKITEHESINESGYRLVLNAGKDGHQMVNHLHFHILGGRPMAWPPG